MNARQKAKAYKKKIEELEEIVNKPIPIPYNYHLIYTPFQTNIVFDRGVHDCNEDALECIAREEMAKDILKVIKENMQIKKDVGVCKVRYRSTVGLKFL